MIWVTRHCPPPDRRYRGATAGGPPPPPPPPPPSSTRKPLWGIVGNNFSDGAGLGNAPVVSPRSVGGEFLTANANRFAKVPLIWGLGIVRNSGGGGNFARAGDWFQYVQAQQVAQNPDEDDTDMSCYSNCMESGGANAVTQRCNNVNAPTTAWTDGTGNRNTCAWVITAGGVRVGAFGSSFAINITSASRRIGAYAGQNFQGNWNASTGTPPATGLAGGDAGKYWVVSVAGNTNLNGNTGWVVNDWAYWNGSSFIKNPRQGNWNASSGTAPATGLGAGDNGKYWVVTTAGETNLNGNTGWIMGDWAVWNGSAFVKPQHIACFTADNFWDEMYGNGIGDFATYGDWSGVYAAPDNCFGNPVSTGDWRLNGGTIAGNSGTTYLWPDGRTETVGAQWRRGYRMYCDRLRWRAAQAGRPFKITPNIELSTTLLQQAEYTNYFEWGLIEATYGGPWQAANQLGRTWGAEYGNAPAGSPNAAFQNGTAFWTTTNNLRAMRDRTLEKRIMPQTYANNDDDGADWYLRASNLREMRYISCACWLSNNFYPAYNPGTGSPASGLASGPIVFDEYQQPLGVPVSNVEPTAAIANGIAGREYTNGLVLVNTTTTNATINPTTIGAGLWKRFNAASYDSQDTTLNNGANVTGNITIPGKDGILLLRQ